MERDTSDTQQVLTSRPRPDTNDGRASDPESALWQQFAQASTPRTFSQSWLPLQCRMMSGVRSAMVLLGPPDRGPFTPVAVWPDARAGMRHLGGAAEQSLKERRGVVVERESLPAGESFPEDFHIAYPVEVDDQIHGTVVLGVDAADRAQVQHLMRQIHWGAAWLEVLIRRTQAATTEQVNQRLQKALDLLASAVEHERFQEAGMAWVTRMANSLECDRVSIGFQTRDHARVAFMSHSADFGKQTNLTRAIEAAMDEAIDQEAVVVFPAPEDGEPLVTRAHAELARQHGCGAICTIPLESEGRPIGALTLERAEDQPFDPETVELSETVGAIAGPILQGRRLEERWLARKAVDAAGGQLRRLLGPGHLIRKLVVAAIVAVTVFFAVFEVDYRVTADTVVEGAVQRVAAAPFNGYIKEAPARPGDVVQKGELLGLLDDRDLRLERLRWLTEKQQYSSQYDEAVAKQERGQIRVLRARMEQADAQIALLDEQLARCRIVAPFDGVVTSGDLSQSLGGPVERGEVLFEVAPLDSFRVIAQVDERDINEVTEGQRSDLVLPAMAGKAFPFVVEKITPVSIAKEGRNFFRVEGQLLERTSQLRPGMEGVGKITVERRKLIWVWSHRALDWLRLQLWRWVP